MKQPIQILNTVTDNAFIDLDTLNTTLKSCGEGNLSIFDFENSPTFYRNTSKDVTQVDLYIYDLNNVEEYFIEEVDYTSVNLGEENQIFVNSVTTNLNEGIYYYVWFFDYDDNTSDFFISDTYRLLDVTCLDYLEYSNNCSLNNVYYNRVEGFTYKIYFDKNSGYQTPTFEFIEEFEEDDNGNKNATNRGFKKVEVYKFFNTNEHQIDVMSYATTFNNFNLVVNGISTNDEIIERSISNINFNNGCCVFNADIVFSREQVNNRGCCSLDILPDCVNYKISDRNVDSFIEENDYATADTTKVYLILESTPSNNSPFKDHVGELAYYNGNGWDYEEVDYVLTNDGWYSNEGLQVNIIQSITQTIPQGKNADVVIENLTENYNICLYSSFEGQQYELIGEFKYNDLVFVGNTTTINVDLTSELITSTDNYEIEFKLECKLNGCLTTETTWEQVFNLGATG